MAEISGGDFGLPERLPENMVVWIGYRTHADNITDIRRVWQLWKKGGALKGLRGTVGATGGRPVPAGVLPRPDYILPFQGIAPKGLYISAQGNTLIILHIRPDLSRWKHQGQTHRSAPTIPSS
ncbi:MAG: hypothetical protein D3917_18790 [Candidatus Electrothrix sp. AX5]|nr:hypothetical protein [Candidatus Electrothrix sp. AX5]